MLVHQERETSLKENEDNDEGHLNPGDFVKCEIDDTTEYPITNTHCDVFREEFYQPKKFIFQQGNIWFIELEEGKVQCGTCGEAFARIISHLISNPNCAINLDLENFKTVWKKFKTEQRRKKYEEKRRTEDPEQYLKDQADRRKKYEEKKKAENPEEFLKNQAQRRKKYEEKKRA